MQKILLIVLMAMVCSPADAQRVDDESTPKGKVYVYKQVDGMNREMEIYFPKGKRTDKKPVAGIILFHGGGWLWSVLVLARLAFTGCSLSVNGE